jgi:hypothetical protein
VKWFRHWYDYLPTRQLAYFTTDNDEILGSVIKEGKFWYARGEYNRINRDRKYLSLEGIKRQVEIDMTAQKLRGK